MHAPTDLTRILAADPGAVIEEVAKAHGAMPRAVVEALPESMRRFAPGDAFVAAMADIATWGDVTFIVHTDDGIFEFSGPLPPGQVARGYFNLMGRSGCTDTCGTSAAPASPSSSGPSWAACPLSSLSST